MKNQTWACDHLKTSNLSADNLKKYLTSMGQHLSPRYGQVILVSGYPVLTAVNWSQHWCAICVQYQSSCAPKLAGKCEIEHWFPCGADGRAGSGRCTVTCLPNFLGWVDLVAHGAPQARFARQSSAINDHLPQTTTHSLHFGCSFTGRFWLYFWYNFCSK